MFFHKKEKVKFTEDEYENLYNENDDFRKAIQELNLEFPSGRVKFSSSRETFYINDSDGSLLLEDDIKNYIYGKGYSYKICCTLMQNDYSLELHIFSFISSKKQNFTIIFNKEETEDYESFFTKIKIALIENSLPSPIPVPKPTLRFYKG